LNFADKITVTEPLPERRSWFLMAGPIESNPAKLGEILSIRLDQPEEIVDVWACQLSADELERARRYHFARDRRRFIVARGELRRILARELDVSVQAIEFAYGPYGKPSLASRFDGAGLRFNLAHSDELAIVALCRNRDVGVDVEAIRPLHDEAHLVSTCFSQREQQEYLRVDPVGRTAAFFSGWTRKEAFIKGLGKGLSQPLDSFDVSVTPAMPAQLLRFENRSGQDCGWCLASFTPAPGFVAAVVTQGRECLVI
jgi:4'-phosphopantetheinyl transferase